MRNFFIYDFTLGFSGLTFPMAIATIAGFKMTTYLNMLGYDILATISEHIAEGQLLLTSSFIFYILLNFFKMWIKE